MDVKAGNKAESFAAIGQQKFFYLALSLLAFAVVAYLDFTFAKERLLHDGGKELAGVINNHSFFSLHPERILLLVSQVLPVLGLKAGCSLGTLVYLYSFNLLFVTLVIWIACIYLKDYTSGIFLCSFHLVGMGFNFFFYPFLEQVYALIFSYLLYRLITHPGQNNIRFGSSILLTALICTAHPTCVLFILAIVLRIDIPRNRKLLYAAIAALTWLAALLYTDISVEKRAGLLSLDMLGLRMSHFTTHFPDLIVLSLAAIYLVLKSPGRLLLLPLMGAGLLPYVFYYQLPTYYFSVPCGLAILILLTERNARLFRAGFILLLLLFAINVFRVVQQGKNYQQVSFRMEELIANARKLGGSKFVIAANTTNSRYFEGNLNFNLPENIKHVSLLFSSLQGKDESLVIESFDFSYEAFGGEKYFKNSQVTDTGIVQFVAALYEDTAVNNLDEKHQFDYEYGKYFDTNHHLNTRYFSIRKEDTYQVIK